MKDEFMENIAKITVEKLLQFKASLFDIISDSLNDGIFLNTGKIGGEDNWEYIDGVFLKLISGNNHNLIIVASNRYELDLREIGDLWLPYSEEFEKYVDYLNECHEYDVTPKDFKEWGKSNQCSS